MARPSLSYTYYCCDHFSFSRDNEDDTGIADDEETMKVAV